MLETPFPFFICKKPGEIPIFGTFLAKKWIFLWILVYVYWKFAFWVRPCLKTSLWRHTLTDFHDFGINGKRDPTLYHGTKQSYFGHVNFKFIRGVVTTPLGKPCYKKGLVGRGLILFNVNLKIYIHFYICKLYLMISTKTTEDFAVTEVRGSKTVGRKSERVHLLIMERLCVQGYWQARGQYFLTNLTQNDIQTNSLLLCLVIFCDFFFSFLKKFVCFLFVYLFILLI